MSHWASVDVPQATLPCSHHDQCHAKRWFVKEPFTQQSLMWPSPLPDRRGFRMVLLGRADVRYTASRYFKERDQDAVRSMRGQAVYQAGRDRQERQVYRCRACGRRGCPLGAARSGSAYDWVRACTPRFIAAAREPRSPGGTRWRVDETYIQLGRRWHDRFRAIDDPGQIVEV